MEEAIKQAEELQEVIEEVTQDTTIEESPTSETTEVDEVNDEIKDEAKKKPRVPLDDLIKERQRRRELEDRLEQIESKLQKSTEPDRVKALQEELGLDEDQALKMDKVLKLYSDGQQSQQSSELKGLESKFQRKAADRAEQYADWNEYQQDMISIYQSKASRDPVGALSIDPEEYYFQAKGRRGLDTTEARQQGAKDAINKSNSKALAGTQSSSSGEKPNPDSGKWTREKIAKLSSEQYTKHQGEILKALRSGQIT